MENLQKEMITIAESVDPNDSTSIYNALDLVLKSTQVFTGESDKGAALFVVEGEGTLIIGLYTNNAHVLDADGEQFETSNITIHAKSNAEVCGGVKLVVYPYLSDSSKLLGFGFNAGAEGGFGEVGTITPNFTNLEPWNLNTFLDNFLKL